MLNSGEQKVVSMIISFNVISAYCSDSKLLRFQPV
jgi:hypothetical protein